MTPIVLYKSARLNIGQKPKSIKSITYPKNILSTKLDITPERIKINDNLIFEFLFLRYKDINMKIIISVKIMIKILFFKMPKARL